MPSRRPSRPSSAPAKRAPRKRAAPARRRKSTRRKVSIGWAASLWILAILNLGVGLGFSTATGLKSVTVQGATAGEVKAIEKRLQPWAKIPWIRHSQEAMETAVLADNRLAKATVTSNVFGRGAVVVTARVPVARINPLKGEKDEKVPDSAIYLDDAGVLYRDYWAAEFAGPDLEVPAAAQGIQLGVIPGWSLLAVSKVAVKSRSFLGELPYKLVLDERSVISLELVDGPLIVLGTESDLNEKFAVLERAFRDEKDKVLGYKLINVSAYERPVFSP